MAKFATATFAHDIVLGFGTLGDAS
jgi:hypothetical protein